MRALIFSIWTRHADRSEALTLALAVNAALAEMGRGDLPHEQIFSYVGQGAPSLISRALETAPAKEDCLRGLEFFIKYYSVHKLVHTCLYPGVRETLDALKGMPMAVLTNKPGGASRGILQGLGLAEHFRFVYGGNRLLFRKKLRSNWCGDHFA